MRGVYCNEAITKHGFVRDKDGTITTFDAGSISNGTSPTSISPAGEITGNYREHGFLWKP